MFSSVSLVANFLLRVSYLWVLAQMLISAILPFASTLLLPSPRNAASSPQVDSTAPYITPSVLYYWLITK